MGISHVREVARLTTFYLLSIVLTKLLPFTCYLVSLTVTIKLFASVG
jgi:hypothetical protein